MNEGKKNVHAFAFRWLLLIDIVCICSAVMAYGYVAYHFLDLQSNAFSMVYMVPPMIGAIAVSNGIAMYFTSRRLKLLHSAIQQVADGDLNVKLDLKDADEYKEIYENFNRMARELLVSQNQVRMSSEAILTIARTVDARSPETGQHSFRVATYSVMIGQRLGFTQQECEMLRRAALLHDIGKLGIPDSILNKPDRLTEEEYALMKTHVTIGGEIFRNMPYLDHVLESVLYHHERYDGKGYMQGLKGEEIPLYARIIGVADAFDAMTSTRVYRESMDLEYAVNELKRGRGTQFDPLLADVMLGLIADGEVNTEELHRRSRLYSKDTQENRREVFV